MCLSVRSSPSLISCQPIQRCKRAFQALATFAIEELCEIANSLITPVRMGVARPTAPFLLVSASLEAVEGSEELFNVDPMPPRPSSANSASQPMSYLPVVQSRLLPSQSDPVRDREEDDIAMGEV